MPPSYFRWLAAETPTRVWINNPTLSDLESALAQGVVGCTTNPAFAAALLRRDPDAVRLVIRDCVGHDGDDREVVDLVQSRLVQQLVVRFAEMFEASGGALGHVSIQGSPHRDHDADEILAEAVAGRELGPNATPKLPATGPGLDAFEQLVEAGSPTIVTEVFSLAQLIETNERYLRAAARSGHTPAFFISPITGIFGDHLKALARESETPVEVGDIEFVGVALSQACQRLVAERGYPSRLLCGGARTAIDLTGLVGLSVDVTINWSTMADVLASAREPYQADAVDIDGAVIHRLMTQFDDVRRAFDIEALDTGEFEEFGPVQYFRSNFIANWDVVVAAVSAERVALAAR